MQLTTRAGQLIYSRRHPGGHVQDLDRAPSVSLLLANPGAVTLTVNGKTGIAAVSERASTLTIGRGPQCDRVDPGLAGRPAWRQLLVRWHARRLP